MTDSSPPLASKEKPDRARRLALFGIAGLLAGGLFIWAGAQDGRSTADSEVGGPFDGARLVSLEQAGAVVETAGHPVFWAGRLPGMKVAVNHDSRKNVHVRYLPVGVHPETSANSYFTVGSYPFERAFEATQELAGEPGRLSIDLPGGVGFLDRLRDDRLVLSFKGHPDLQVEVFHPRLEEALAAVRRGAIVPIE